MQRVRSNLSNSKRATTNIRHASVHPSQGSVARIISPAEVQWDGVCSVLARCLGSEGLTMASDLSSGIGEWDRIILTAPATPRTAGTYHMNEG
jgi:hypothetical protein